MADTSPNALPHSVESMGQRLPSEQSVYREPIELFRLEQALPFAQTPEQQYQILSLVLSRELAQALNIVDPPVGNPLRKDWAADIRKLREIATEFRNRKIPVPTFPSLEPLTGKDIPEYLVTVDGDTPVSVVLGADIKPFLEVMMRHRLQSAYQEAIKPLWSWHLDTRTLLSKYKVWDMSSEFVASISAYTQGDVDSELKRANEYVQGLAARGQNDGIEPEDSGEVDFDSDSEGDDDSEAPPSPI